MTSLVVHVSQDLRTTNSNTVGTGKDGLGNVTAKLETGRHVGEETGLVRQVDELERISECELEDLHTVSVWVWHPPHRQPGTHDALRGVAVGSTVKGDLVKATEGGELNASSTNFDIVGDDGEVALGIGFGEVIDERGVEVEGGREDLLVVPQDVTRQGTHVGNGLGCGKGVHGDLGLGGAKLESSGTGRRGEVDDLDEVQVESTGARVLDSSTDKVLDGESAGADRKEKGQGLTVLGADEPVWSRTRANSKIEGIRYDSTSSRAKLPGRSRCSTWTMAPRIHRSFRVVPVT